MVYYKKYSLIYWSILKNGTKVFRDLLNEIIGDNGIDVFQFNRVTEKNFIILFSINLESLQVIEIICMLPFG